jgi:pyruvate dehydrogenase E1 component alpha subunit
MSTTRRPTRELAKSAADVTKKALAGEDAAAMRRMLRDMLLIRRFEERAGEQYALGRIGGFCHLYIGQEAVAVGTMAALKDGDYIMGSYREHGQALARGMSSRSVMAELFGKATGCCGGKGGSMHIFDAEKGFLGGHAIVGGHIPLVTGAAFAAKYRGEDKVAVCFFGEAAVNNGAFHEALNMAALWKLPAIYICENNRYGMGTAMERASAIWDVAARACSYDMPAETVDGMEVLAVRDAVARAATRGRTEQIPTLLEIRTYRFMGHSMSDPIHGHYRTKEEVEQMKLRDPVVTFHKRLVENGMLNDEQWQAMEADVQAEVEDAVRFADESPDPDPAELFTHVYSEAR